MSNASQQNITTNDVLEAQRIWADAVVAQDINGLASLYDFEILLFKPTMAAHIRIDEAGTRSYFVGGDPRFSDDKGFLHHGFIGVRFESARGPMLEAGGGSAQDMGHYYFSSPDGTVVKADYSFSYHKRNGKVLITLHHSSFNVENKV